MKIILIDKKNNTCKITLILFREKKRIVKHKLIRNFRHLKNFSN